MSSGLEHAIGPQGWGDGTLTEAEMIRYEAEYHERAAADMPIAYRSRPTTNSVLPGVQRRWSEAMERKGMRADSMCLNTLEEITWGRKFAWLPQDIGSCVASNTFRVWVQRAIAQIAARGDGEEYDRTVRAANLRHGSKACQHARKRRSLLRAYGRVAHEGRSARLLDTAAPGVAAIRWG
jgi:hypothetical protein